MLRCAMCAYVKVTVLSFLEVLKKCVLPGAQIYTQPSHIHALRKVGATWVFSCTSSFLCSFCYVIAICFSPHSVSRRCVCVCLSPFLQLVQDSLVMDDSADPAWQSQCYLPIPFPSHNTSSYLMPHTDDLLCK